jgi:hypothetical protein
MSLQNYLPIPTMEKISRPWWLPRSVAYRVGIIAANMIETDEQQKILTRLTTDVRMHSVWRQFARRNQETGEFFFPAKPRPDWNYPAKRPPWDDAMEEDVSIIVQAQALDELFFFVFCAAKDRRRASTPEEADTVRRDFMERARILRECAQMRRQDLIGDPQGAADADAVDRVADWLEGISLEILSPTDPLSVWKKRGDPIVRGVSIQIGNYLMDRFGSRLDGIAGTLASVALGKDANLRAIRSALTRTK